MAAKKGGRRRRTRIIVVGAAIVVVAVAGYFAYRAFHSTASAAVRYTTEAAQKMTLTSSVSGTGNVVLGSSATVSPSVSGTVSGLAVKVGDRVTKGQVLFTLVNAQLDLAVETAQNSYNQAVNSLSQAKLSVLQAKKSLSDLKEQKSEQSAGAAVVASAVQAASATQVTPVALAEASAVSATLYPAHSSSTTGTTADSTPDSSTTSSSTTESTSTTTLASTTTTAHTSTTQTLPAPSVTGNTTTTVKAITTLDIEVAEQQVTTAELGVTSAQSQIESAKLSLQQAEDTAAARDVTAPMDGTVTTLSISDGDTLGSSSSSSSAATGSSTSSSTGPSTSSSSSTSAMVITDLSSFEATVTLAEADVASVTVGQKATMTFDALPDLTITGKVESVDNAGTISQSVVSYTVTINPDVTNDGVKGGMTVTADIITSVTADALVVPSTAVKTDSSGANYVQILTNGSPVNQTVVVGTSNDTYTQITSGLTEGQEVVTQTINPASSTGTTSGGLGGGGIPSGGGSFPSGGIPSGGGSFPSGGIPGGG